MRNPSCVFGATWSAQGNFLPKLCPYVWGCEKEPTETILDENDFGVVKNACTSPKHGSGDVRKQKKEFTPHDIATIFVGVPHAVN